MFAAIRQATRAKASMPLRSRLAAPRVPAYRTIVTKRYTEEHEAVSFDDETGLGTVSITDHAQSSLGDVVYVELPVIGSEVTQGALIGAVESVKAASDIYAPVSGKVVEINERLNDQPGLLNKSPEDEGWLCKIELSAPGEMSDLLDLEAYKNSYS
ncbi:single hybrid motif-containing protein [Hygrophoropsis aurantiaca]|uniref:Single hybrid motif-containing protein n=1 Tax=Hygrophoropsis aurantiaca TaxID=72124 RepID=A0ACB8AS46_9AGAM|nr:single hybrid motif-containing protein [Hygrophoropsis aurantiaca]